MRSSQRSIDVIIAVWRMRQRWHSAEKKLVLQGKAFCRACCNGDRAAAARLYKAAEKGKVDTSIMLGLLPFLEAIDGFRKRRKEYEKKLAKLVEALPVHAWVSDVRGFGSLNLAALIGEAGDIGSYPNPSSLWKRMGLAVIDGKRQQKIAGNAELATRHGYDPRRRAVAYILGDCLIKAGELCRYRPLYEQHKAYQLENGRKLGHAHKMAQRYMVKRVLVELWAAWNAARDAA